jgi:hypothetical protein
MDADWSNKMNISPAFSSADEDGIEHDRKNMKAAEKHAL